jgi:acetyl-CoA carboxylase biotin carboxyl carrier protein
MDLKKLNEFISLAKESGVSELQYENGKEKYSVKLGSSAPLVMDYARPALGTNQVAGNSKEVLSPDTSGLLEVTSPFVGTFYRSSSPDSAVYAQNGDKVGKGKVLCIVEAMKIMNEIESEVTGEIVEICVENETYVEFGQVLFRIKP